MEALFTFNLLTILLLVILLGSAIQGARKGASGSARQFMALVLEGIVTLLALFLSWKWMLWSSPHVSSWLISRNITIPNAELNGFRQMYYTFVTALRDFSLMRSAILFLIGYGILKNVLTWLVYLVLAQWAVAKNQKEYINEKSWMSVAAGGVIGSLTGVGRVIMMIALLFTYTALFPQAALTTYIEDSALYQKGAQEVIQPFTGEFLVKQLPVFTRAVEKEFKQILQRKYEVLDAQIPPNIAEAAKKVTENAKTDEAKARALYTWVGTRVTYDWDKVNDYEQKRIWHEQTPEDTFATKKGVCIDYSRLYAVMARAVGLDVKVVTGLGYNGQGSYGSHAWNEVFLTAQDKYVPLDSTWVSSGEDWFNPPQFNETHIREDA
ncbi:transglutaminase domain-containing protein [Paenibacillus psychroresistens]|uniref:Transglutaminase domain-containing protein n=1 Tax=Paenibacillus psychroresistens TaxID=1778678 RepID=A0A6B8RGU5_9BACL|nr:transglutaminase-like domain-containing protein [Paenibacillus psychroresistens]QGQ94944.1 transglutaminase domain-containing protein [Paenibacillus psychroresistens]